MTVFSVLLEARDPARNYGRSYHVKAGRSLFGTWLVDITFGRIGAPTGRTVRYVVTDEILVRGLARASLRRRASAPRRIGVSYVTRELVDPDGWTSAAWHLTPYACIPHSTFQCWRGASSASTSSTLSRFPSTAAAR